MNVDINQRLSDSL